jgi:hypothetical protein
MRKRTPCGVGVNVHVTTVFKPDTCLFGGGVPTVDEPIRWFDDQDLAVDYAVPMWQRSTTEGEPVTNDWLWEFAESANSLIAWYAGHATPIRRPIGGLAWQQIWGDAS